MWGSLAFHPASEAPSMSGLGLFTGLANKENRSRIGSLKP